MKLAARSSSVRETAEGKWLLLVHNLPVRPSNARVKTWRRLQQLGALPLRKSVYVLPNTSQAREDFEWLKSEVEAQRGEASVFAADSLDSIEDRDIIAAFREARERDFKELGRDVTRMLTSIRRAARSPLRARLERMARTYRERLQELQSIDFFGAAGGKQVATALERLEQQVSQPVVASAAVRAPALAPLDTRAYRKRVWVTRPRPGVDRMACAWLIRRYIDPNASFRFAEDASGVRQAEVPFDMFGVEFSHQGTLCTFEVLATRIGVRDAPVRRMGEIVHDLDLKVDQYGAGERQTIGELIDGLRDAFTDDQELLAHGIVLFEALYQSFRRQSGRSRKPSVSRQRAR